MIALYYAQRAGLRARVFEAQPGVGGLWRQLPAWQDIQIAAADWTLGDIPLAGTFAPQIAANIQAWVDRFDMASSISLNTPVHASPRPGGGWTISTPEGDVTATHLVAATGAHNRPFIPPVRRNASGVKELHSSALEDPSVLAGQSVLVVGAGASALDLLDLAVQHGAREIAWAHRGLRWFTPTRKTKAIAGSVRDFSRLQASGMTHAQQSAFIEADLRGRYAKFGLQAIVPAFPFDILQQQLIPGRHRMIEHFAAIRRIAAEVEHMQGDTVTLTDGTALRPDVVLWGTGYSADLSWLDVPALATMRSATQLREHCGGGFRSLDAAQLYFLAVGLDGLGSTSFAFALSCRSIMSHIRGTADLGLEPVTHNINHFDLAAYLAPRDPASFPAGWQKVYRDMQLTTPDDQPYPIPQ
ncbi:NAD(P)-binding domain-containing protein [Caenimonas koreensis]|uniref:NAD(P)-binding domain-containing protein n=1 Tax=Caenimonas koreensis TaxID=367474 RepID=UPI003784BBE9